MKTIVICATLLLVVGLGASFVPPVGGDVHAGGLRILDMTDLTQIHGGCACQKVVDMCDECIGTGCVPYGAEGSSATSCYTGTKCGDDGEANCSETGDGVCSETKYWGNKNCSGTPASTIQGPAKKKATSTAC